MARVCLLVGASVDVEQAFGKFRRNMSFPLSHCDPSTGVAMCDGI